MSLPSITVNVRRDSKDGCARPFGLGWVLGVEKECSTIHIKYINHLKHLKLRATIANAVCNDQVEGT